MFWFQWREEISFERKRVDQFRARGFEWEKEAMRERGIWISVSLERGDRFQEKGEINWERDVSWERVKERHSCKRGSKPERKEGLELEKR